MGTVGLYVFGFLWTVAVVLWPLSSEVTPPVDEAIVHANGEDLYKSSLTQAPFGLLGVNFFESVAGKKRWNIRSRFAELHRKEDYALMQAVDADFFAEKTGNLIQTKSDKGRSQIEKNIVELEGNVSIRSRRGYLFQMDKLNYNGASHEFTTDDVVHMKGPVVEKPSMFLKGTGLIGNIDTEHFLLKRNVSAQRQLKSAEWLRITSRSGEFFTEDQRAIFLGKVHSQLPKVAIDSDIFELGVANDQESLNARGNVILRQKDRIGRAETAFMQIGSSKIVLEGNARVDSRDNQIRGRRIVLYSDDERIEVESAQGKVHQ